jgi:hypothetical protein
MSRLPGGRVNSIAELLTGDALYLFYCGVQWRKCGDSDAGSELVRALQSNDRDVVAVAAAMLSNARRPFSPSVGLTGAYARIGHNANH